MQKLAHAMFLHTRNGFVMQHMDYKIINHQKGWRYGYQSQEKYAVGF